jgi:phenylacetate-coenzyme A ligase PaaK-like adenylate-forming protein
MLSDSAWDNISSTMNGQIVDYYGQAERVCLAYRYAKSEWWFHPAYGKVELVPISEGIDEQGGERYARVVGTGYWNLRMPLVRYCTGDLIAYPEHYGVSDLKEIAEGRKSFIRVVGRDSEYLVTPSGGKVQALNNIARELISVDQVQFIQKTPKDVEIRIKSNRKISDIEEREITRIARMRIPNSMTILIETDKPLRQTPNGKTPFVIRELG